MCTSHIHYAMVEWCEIFCALIRFNLSNEEVVGLTWYKPVLWMDINKRVGDDTMMVTYPERTALSRLTDSKDGNCPFCNLNIQNSPAVCLYSVCVRAHPGSGYMVHDSSTQALLIFWMSGMFAPWQSTQADRQTQKGKSDWSNSPCTKRNTHRM